MSYDSTPDTLKHIRRVAELLGRAASEYIRRGAVHDQSKLESPEKEIFDEITPMLGTLTYGTPEYRASAAKTKIHQEKNSHHPEFYPPGEITDSELLAIKEKLDKVTSLFLSDGLDVKPYLAGLIAEKESRLNGMDLFDIVEMFFDWKAAGERHADGSMLRSISINESRFAMSSQLANLFRNTVERYPVLLSMQKETR